MTTECNCPIPNFVNLGELRRVESGGLSLFLFESFRTRSLGRFIKFVLIWPKSSDRLIRKNRSEYVIAPRIKFGWHCHPAYSLQLPTRRPA